MKTFIIYTFDSNNQPKKETIFAERFETEGSMVVFYGLSGNIIRICPVESLIGIESEKKSPATQG